MQDDYALPELSPDEKRMYGSFWKRFRSNSSLGSSVDEESVQSPTTAEIVEPSPAFTQSAAPALTTAAVKAPTVVAKVAAPTPTTASVVAPTEVANFVAPTPTTAAVVTPMVANVVAPTPTTTAAVVTAAVANVVAPTPTTAAVVAPAEVANVVAPTPTTAVVTPEVANVVAPTPTTAAVVAPAEVANVVAPTPATAAVVTPEVANVGAAVAKGPPSVPPKMELPAVPTRAATEHPGQPSTTTAGAAPMTNEALTMLAALLSQSMGQLSVADGADSSNLGSIQESLKALVAKATGGAAAQPLQQQQQQQLAVAPVPDVSVPPKQPAVVDKTKIIDSASGLDLQPSPASPSPATAPATPSPSINPPGTPSTPPPCTTLALARPGPTAIRSIINSGTHKTEYKTFQRFCENSPGAEELKKVWVQGGPQRLAMFQKFVLTGDPKALECALRFRRQREEEDKDEGEYYPWKDILAFHDGNETKALQFVQRRRTEPTSCDRNDATVETFLYYGRQKKSFTNRTIVDDIAMTMGCSPSFAASVAAQLDTMNGAVPIQGSSGGRPSVEVSENPPNPKPPPKNGKTLKQNAGVPETTTTEDPPPKKARPARPEGSDLDHDLELAISTEGVTLFVKSWVAAANTAQGQAVKTCAELEVLDSQEALMSKVRDCADGIGACRKKLQLLGPAPVASDVQSALLEATRTYDLLSYAAAVFVEGFKKHMRVANGLIAAEKRPAKTAKKAKAASKAES
ncbi:unnamed protein product [Symbiodinium sp. CCMP2592]|nr:unnamed protein product [Symbiodinium sp. CCMP2592]